MVTWLHISGPVVRQNIMVAEAIHLMEEEAENRQEKTPCTSSNFLQADPTS
jgi:hypothetical protein